MTRWTGIARTRFASGRFLLPLLALLVSCGGGPAVDPAAEPPRWPDPVLERGSISASQADRAAELYASAERALEAGDAAEARELATRIVQDHPSAPVSGRALFLLARATLESGDPEAADRLAGRFARLLAEGDPRVAEAHVLQAEAQERLGDQRARLERLLRIPPGAATNVLLRAVEDAREAAAQLDTAAVSRLLGRTPPGQPLRAVALARYAFLLQRAGDEEQARVYARAALDAGARGVDSLNADAVVRGVPLQGPEGEVRSLGIGTVLPTSGSPGFREFAALIAEGVEVAAATWLEGSAEVRVEARDDRGDPAAAVAQVRALENSGVLGVVGFLEEGALEAAAAGRAGPLPLVSPTARVAGAEGVYTLSGADPLAAAAMGRWAARQGFVRVAVIHSRAPESSEEADAFVAALQENGVLLAGRFAYDAGATYFEEQIKGARDVLRADEIRALGLGPDDTLRVEMLEPVAVFAPVPPEDVELLAPQITFFGLDTLAIRTLGTSGWTDPQTLRTVDQRHTTGVVATAPLGGGPGSRGHDEFRQAFESHFRRTLVSPVPALGYDAAALLLEASRSGADSPARLRAALERIRDLEGATGTFSILDGRVVRRTHIVQIEHGTLIPAG